MIIKGIIKRNEDYTIAEKEGNKFKCLSFDQEKNSFSKYVKISDLGKKQYNYDKDGMKGVNDDCQDKGIVTSGGSSTTSNLIAGACASKETYTKAELLALYAGSATTKFDECNKIYISENELNDGIENKDLSDRFLTTLILSLFVCLASIGLALFGFLLFRTPGDF